MKYSEAEKVVNYLALDEVFLHCNTMLEQMVPLVNRENRVGGMCFIILLPHCSVDHCDALYFHGEYLGVITEEEEKFRRNAYNKLSRLVAHPRHVTARSSRNPDNDDWAGGIRIPVTVKQRVYDLIVTFSGMPEVVDEMIVAAGITNIADEEVRKILLKEAVKEYNCELLLTTV